MCMFHGTGLGGVLPYGEGKGAGQGWWTSSSEQGWTGHVVVTWDPPQSEQAEWLTDRHDWKHYLPRNCIGEQ